MLGMSLSSWRFCFDAVLVFLLLMLRHFPCCKYLTINTKWTVHQVGRFDSDTRRISSLNPQSILTATGARADSVNTQCTGRCAQCQHAFAYQEFGYVPGDWLIAGTFSISNPGPVGQQPYVCGEIRTTNGFQYSAAMMYALNQINRWDAILVVIIPHSFMYHFSSGAHGPLQETKTVGHENKLHTETC